MKFELSITINCPPLDVFAFLRDIEQHPQKEDSPVLVLEKTTAGPPGVGTRYREVVQMLPFVQGEIISEITHFEPERLELDWHGAGMEGHLAYYLKPAGEGTRLVQQETLYPRGVIKLFSPFIGFTFPRRLRWRLENIKKILESGGSGTSPQE